MKKRNVIRVFLAFILPIVILFGGYYTTYYYGLLTNHILKVTTGHIFKYIPLIGFLGLLVTGLSLFFLAVITRVLWLWAGSIMDCVERKKAKFERERERREQQERLDRFSSQDSPVPVPRTFPGGEALRHNEPEVLDEDRAYRERIGVE